MNPLGYVYILMEVTEDPGLGPWFFKIRNAILVNSELLFIGTDSQ